MFLPFRDMVSVFFGTCPKENIDAESRIIRIVILFIGAYLFLNLMLLLKPMGEADLNKPNWICPHFGSI